MENDFFQKLEETLQKLYDTDLTTFDPETLDGLELRAFDAVIDLCDAIVEDVRFPDADR